MARRNRPHKKKTTQPKISTRPLSLKETHLKNGGNEKTWWALLHSLKPGWGLRHSPNRQRLVSFRYK